MQITDANAKVEQQQDGPRTPFQEDRLGATGEERKQPEAAKEEETACADARRAPSLRISLIAGVVFVVLAAYAGWDWLVATGVAAVLVAVGPCLLMCALGFCMRHGKSKAGASPAEARKDG